MNKLIALIVLPITLMAINIDKNLTISQMEKGSDMILEGEILKIGRYDDGTYDVTFRIEDDTTKILKGRENLHSKHIVGFHYSYKGKDEIPLHKIMRKNKIMKYYLKIKKNDNPILNEFVLYDDKLGAQEIDKH